jgi:ankyrin repeat protein
MDNRIVNEIVCDGLDTDSESDSEEIGNDQVDLSKIQRMTLELEKEMSTPLAWPDSDNEACNKILSASASGDLRVLRQFMKDTPLLVDRVRNKFRWTVVHFSAFYGHKEVLEELLLRYPHLKDKREKNKWTPLLAAAWNGHFEIAKYLIQEQQCRHDVKTAEGDNLLAVAAIRGNSELVHWLMEHCGIVPTLDHFGRNILLSVCYTGDIDLFDMFVSKYELPPDEWFENHGRCPLIEAAAWGQFPLFKHMIEKYHLDVKVKSKVSICLCILKPS